MSWCLGLLVAHQAGGDGDGHVDGDGEDRDDGDELRHSQVHPELVAV